MVPLLYIYTLHSLTVQSHSSVQDISSTVLSVSGNTALNTVSVSGKSTLHDVSMNNTTVTGDLHVTGEIYGASQSNMEVVYFNLTGNSGSATETMQRHHNSANNTNYAVFPSIYYGYSGSSGTYNAQNSSSSLNNIVITNRTSSSFSWTTTKTTGDNINVYIVFLVVYGVSNSGFPSSY